jgi:hypothetical protein
MSVVTRNRSLIERLTGSGKPKPSKFDPCRNSKTAAREPAASSTSVSSRWHPSTNRPRNDDRFAIVADLAKIALPGFLASALFGWMLLMGGGLPAVGPKGSHLGLIAGSILATVPALLVILQARRILQWVRRTAEAALGAAGEPKTGETAAGTRPGFARGRFGPAGIWIAIVLISLATPVLDPILDRLTDLGGAFASILPLAVFIWLFRRRSGAAPQARVR